MGGVLGRQLEEREEDELSESQSGVRTSPVGVRAAGAPSRPRGISTVTRQAVVQAPASALPEAASVTVCR